MRRDRGRLLIIGAALVIALVILLFPPWNVRAIRTTTRYAGVPGVAPATVVDTVSWALRVFPLLAPPRAPLSAIEMRDLVIRLREGDNEAKRRLILATEPFEGRVHAPAILRTSGEIWRDSVLAAAGLPSISWYEVEFTLDDLGIALRLAAVALVAVILDRRRIRAGLSRPARAEDHKSVRVRR
jgi:hypothetical protein